VTARPTEFRHGDFVCDVEVSSNGDDLVVRFFGRAHDHEVGQIRGLVIADPGIGFLALRFKGDAALLTGFLQEHRFADPGRVEAAIEFLESLSPKAANAYIPHHVDLFRNTTYVEYNGEY
jgi:hypothetical protein